MRETFKLEGISYTLPLCESTFERSKLINTNILDETRFLYNQHFNDKEKKILYEIEDELNKELSEYDLSLLWSYDAAIGKIGAYSMPANPTLNPFPGGIARKIYRPLQYARAAMDIMDINMRPRNIIRDIGLHFEGLTRYILKKETRLKSRGTGLLL